MKWQIELSPKAQNFRERCKPEAMKQVLPGEDPPSEYELDIFCFAQAPFGHSFKGEFMVRLWQHQWRDDVELRRMGIENDWSIKIAHACCSVNRLCLVGCGSASKTFSVAMYGYTMWKVDPFNTSVYLSTTSGEAGEARTWGAVKDLFTKDRYRVGKRLDTLQLITLDEEVRDDDGAKQRDLRDVIKCVKIKPGAEGKNVVGTICGRKNKKVIWACDEAAFMDLGILDARTTLFTNPFGQNINIGNGPAEGDPLYIDAEPYGPEFPDGWRSVNKDLHERWPTKAGICLYFNGAKSPNFRVPKDKPIPFPRLMNWKFQQEILASAFGEDSPMYWKMFYGFPPSVDVPDKVLTHALLEKFGAFSQPEWKGDPLKVLAGFDPGFRKDGDPCVIDFGTIGKDVQGRTVLCHSKDGIVLTPIANSKDPFEKQIAQRVVSECRSRGCHDLAIDVSSDGGLLLQAIEREAREQKYALNVLGISSLGSPEDRIIIPGEKRTGKEMFDRLVSQHWVSYRMSVGNNVIRGAEPNSRAVQQLCGRKFGTDERRRFSIEPKKEYKKRLKHSPDFADARVYLHVLALKHGLSGAQKPQVRITPKGNPIEEQQERRGPYSGHSTRPLYAGR